MPRTSTAVQVPSNGRSRRINGLHGPYTSSQIGGWIALVISILQFILCITPILPFYISLIVTVLFLLVCCTVLYYGYITITIDPIDIHLYKILHPIDIMNNNNNNTVSNHVPTIPTTPTDMNSSNHQQRPIPQATLDNNNNNHDIEARQQQQQQPNHETYTFDDDNNNNNTTITNNNNSNNKQRQKINANTMKMNMKMICCSASSSNNQILLNPLLLQSITLIENMKQCWICDSQVASHSMHCKFCNKCVYKFDHHCMWLNTCVGKSNYQYFFKTMILLLLFEFVHFIIQLILFLDIFIQFGLTKQRATAWFIGYIGTICILGFFILFNIISLLLLGQLTLLHIKLQKKHLTTYEYIVQESKNKREYSKLKGDLDRQRIREIEYAKRNKQSIRVVQLQFGGFCRDHIHCSLFDPLSMPKPHIVNPDNGFGAALGNNNSNNSYDNSLPDLRNNNSIPDSNFATTSNTVNDNVTSLNNSSNHNNNNSTNAGTMLTHNNNNNTMSSDDIINMNGRVASAKARSLDCRSNHDNVNEQQTTTKEHILMENESRYLPSMILVTGGSNGSGGGVGTTGSSGVVDAGFGTVMLGSTSTHSTNSRSSRGKKKRQIPQTPPPPTTTTTTTTTKETENDFDDILLGTKSIEFPTNFTSIDTNDDTNIEVSTASATSAPAVTDATTIIQQQSNHSMTQQDTVTTRSYNGTSNANTDDDDDEIMVNTIQNQYQNHIDPTTTTTTTKSQLSPMPSFAQSKSFDNDNTIINSVGTCDEEHVENTNNTVISTTEATTAAKNDEFPSYQYFQ